MGAIEMDVKMFMGRMKNKRSGKYWIGVSILILLLLLILFPATGDCSPYGTTSVHAPTPTKEPQFFSRELIIELEHSSTVDIRNMKKQIEEQLKTYFQSYSYYNDFSALFAANTDLTRWTVPGATGSDISATNTELQNTINTKLNILDQKESTLFYSLRITADNIYTFGKDKYRSFVPVILDCMTTEKDQDILLFLLSAGISLKNQVSTAASICNGLFRIKGVYVNWMFVNQEYVFTGGTGGLPVSNPGGMPFPFYDIKCHNMGIPAASEAFRILNDHISNPGSSAVDVYVLDTIPGNEKIQNARQYYYFINMLAQEMLDCLDFRFHIIPYKPFSSNYYYLPNEKSSNHDMADHGIYIAGTIKNLSPSAELHLVEVLNRYGSGTLESLLWGFQKVLQNQQGKTTPFIINSSLTSKIIMYKDPAARYRIIKEYTGKSSILPVFYAMEQQQIFFPALTYIIDTLRTYNCTLVAAAGNDSANCPGYPAILGEDPAFGHVLAAGAGNSTGNMSSFSNFPGNNGILAYGGEINSNKITLEAINSLYFNKFYTGNNNPNNSGWARWAGSSFSAGIVSGAMAALISRGLYNLPAARNILKDSCSINAANLKFLPVF